MRKLFGFALFAAAAGLSLAAAPATTAPQDKKIQPEIEVPFVPTHQTVVEAMLKLAAVKEGDTVYDLGCGDGRIVITAVGKFKAERGLGIDFNPARLKECDASLKQALADKKLTDEQAKNITFKQGDVLKMKPEDFKDVDVVTLYLLPDVNDRLQPILKAGLKDGARVVSHDFSMTGWREDKKERVMADRTHDVYLWTIKKAK
ncbi:MAG: class I SAM-dependent methyltransferase [Gemmataceae bacterium]|nr:class I SAM-dependent methyltransferase [Gemmataceae bacterium]